MRLLSSMRARRGGSELRGDAVERFAQGVREEIEVFLGDRWQIFDPRNNDRRIGRILVARGRDAADVPLTLSFGPSTLVKFTVTTEEVSAA